MKKYKILCLTDHSGHSKENSIYSILAAMSLHPQCLEVLVASRGNKSNDAFFYQNDFSQLHGLVADQNFNFESSKELLHESNLAVNPDDYDIIFLRLPRPTTDEFLQNIAAAFASKCIINEPLGIIRCSSKAVLVNFQNVCPPLKLCKSVKDVLSFTEQYDLVLKPLKEYGGKGLIRIKGGILNDGMQDYDVLEYLKTIEVALEEDGYLAMKYLKNVNQGDKRLIVVGGEILAASLRLPAQDSWLCNVALGGTSVNAKPDEREIEIVEQINPFLLENGILIYGADTLVDDDGKRILSEINALSIGGFPQAQEQTGRPIIKLTLDKIFAHADVHYTKN